MLLLLSGCLTVFDRYDPVFDDLPPVPPRTLSRELADVAVTFPKTEGAAEPGTRRTISLAETVDRALSDTIDVALARAEEQIARGQARSVEGALLPSIEMGGWAGRTDGHVQGSFGDIRDVTFNRYEPGVGLVWRVNIGAQVNDALASRYHLDDAILLTLDAEQRLLLRVAELYLDLSLARYERGTAIVLEVLDAADALAQARLDLARAIVDFNRGQVRLLASSGAIRRETLIPSKN